MLSEEQRFLFDTRGYIVIRDVLSDGQIKELRATLKNSTEQFPPVPQSEGPLHWGRIWRDLLDIEELSSIFEDLIGNPHLRQFKLSQGIDLPTFRLDHINVHTHIEKGFAGGKLHGGHPAGGHPVAGIFNYHDGTFFNGLTTVAFELFDTEPNGGGFACIPGTHNGNVAIPENWVDLSEGVSDGVTRVATKPGDAVIFTEAMIHGTLPWTVDDPRKTIFYKFSPHIISWSADFFDPEDFRDYHDMDNRKLAILEPPNARYPHRPTLPRWR